MYDHNGQRIKRTEGSVSDYYFYENGVVSVIEDSSSVTAANLLTNEGGLAGSFRGTTYHNYLTDVQGSTTNIIKEDGTLSATYDSKGRVTDITKKSGTAVYTTNEVHHIVAKTAKKAKLARRIYVTRTKHEIDDPRNLIPLKKGLHKRLHRKQYFELVNVIVSKAYHSTKTYKKKVNKIDNAVKKIRNSLSIMNEASPF